MKKIAKFLALAFIISAFAATSYAQTSATATATASATILTPLAITRVTDLNFGDIFVSNVAGTVVVGTDGSRSVTGGCTAAGGTVTAASFDVAGEGTSTYAITLPLTHEITNGTETMDVTTFVSDPSGTGALTGGAQTISVGATLEVDASQAPGLYTNAAGFEVRVEYN